MIVKRKCLYFKNMTSEIAELKRIMLEGFDSLQKQIDSKGAKDCDYTVLQYAQIWLDTYKKGKVQPSTLTIFNGELRNYISPLFGDIKLNELDDITAQKKLLSIPYPRAREKTYTTLKQIYKKAQQQKYVIDNPFDTVELPKHEKEHGKAMTRQQESKFVKACMGDEYCFTFLTMLYGGLRRGEALSLCPCDINVKKNVRKKQNPYLIITKNLWQNKPCNLRQAAEEKFQSFKIYMRCVENSGNGTERICNVNEATLDRHFKQILQKSGLKGQKLTIHCLRHTFITRCAERKINPKTVQKWAGHATLDMTLNVYSHVNNDFEYDEYEEYNKGVKC